MNTQQVVIRDDEEMTSGLPAGYENSGSLAVSLARAEIDQQIITARAMPRSISKAVANITTLATLDEETAIECIYALPRAGKAIKGPSIRLAEIISAMWGNCRVGARVVHVDRFEKFVEAEGVFHDLETNTATTSRVRRRLSNKRGDLLQEDMIVVTGNAACAIAKRNAILGGVPKAVWRKAYEAVEHVIAGDIKTLSERRGKAMQAFAAFGVTPEQIFAALGVGGLEDIGLEHLSTLTASRSALKSGEATIEELFPKVDPKANGAKMSMTERLDALAKMPAHDPATGEITASEAKSSDVSRNEAGDGGRSGGTDERQSIAPAIGPVVGSQEPRGAAPKQGPPEGAEAGGHAAASASDAQNGLSGPNAALLADLEATGDIRAAAGGAALEDYLEGLTASERILIGAATVKRWQAVAAGKDGAR